MNRKHAGAQYTTRLVANKNAGSAGVELYCEIDGVTTRVAQILFWDASGQFFLEVFGGELPVEIVEGLIAEARESIKT
jgi:hypothetical protein